MRVALASACALALAACAAPAPSETSHSRAETVPPDRPGPHDADLAGERWIAWRDREAAIERELRALGPHPWAGVYSRGDLFDVNWTLKIAPRAGFTFRWAGCGGVTDRNLGSVREESGALVLECLWPNARPEDPWEPRGCPERLQPIAWSARSYLATDPVFFCSQVNAGLEPRASLIGAVLLRAGDERKPVSGKPQVPPELEHCLLDGPLRARVIAVGEPTFLGELQPRRRRTLVTLDVGREDGAYAGMCLRSRLDVPGPLLHLDVIELDARSSVAEFLDLETPGDSLPEVGTICATRWE